MLRIVPFINIFVYNIVIFWFMKKTDVSIWPLTSGSYDARIPLIGASESTAG